MASSSVAVVVLGDIGRSPRMQYHSLSLSQMPSTSEVSVVGFHGERCVDEVESSDKIKKYYISTPFAKASRRLFLFYMPLKVLFQILQLFWILLFSISRPSAILVQNPPSIPTLLVVWLVCRLRGSRFVIDWHNFGYTVLSHSRGKGDPLVAISKVYERFFAALADDHFCVTNAMRVWLEENWGVRARVLYDRPPSFFQPSSTSVTHELATRIAPSLPTAADFSSDHRRIAESTAAQPAGSSTPSTGVASSLFTVKEGGIETKKKTTGGASSSSSSDSTMTTTTLRRDRPALIVSSTSWTEDEDFGILLDALIILDKVACEPSRNASFPDFCVLVTGKGPLRSHYEARIASLQLKRVCIRTLWLEAADYPRLLGSADLGVSLHTSTSGLDLPMKVVDMYGAGLPVCAVGFVCLDELVKHNQNGLVFSSAGELAAQLVELFDGFPFTERGAEDDVAVAEEDEGGGDGAGRVKPKKSNGKKAAAATSSSAAPLLQRLARGVAAFREDKWASNWNKIARCVFEGAGEGGFRSVIIPTSFLLLVIALAGGGVYWLLRRFF